MKGNPLKRIGIWVFSLLLLILLLNGLMSNGNFVENYYSKSFYPIFSWIPKILFGWIPFSFGDVCYALLLVLGIYLLLKSIFLLFRKQGKKALYSFLKLIILLLGIYAYFHISWGLNYYRTPISKQLNLNTDTVLLEDHLSVLSNHIQLVNALREKLDFNSLQRKEAEKRIESLMKNDMDFPMLSKTQVQIKYPFSNTLASYFGVSGYFNPLTHEAHINGKMPLASYPFTVAHELSHQMGIGFEDECNFIAYVKLHQQQDPWFAYSAYYESVSYLLRSLYLVDPVLFKRYKEQLSPKVLGDFKTDQEFWKNYTGWIADISGLFYDQYLKHNNQAEGMARYGMVTRLIIAYEKNKRPLE